MLILSIQTAGSVGEAALLDDDTVVAEAPFGADRRHAEEIFPVVRDLLDEAGLEPCDLDAVAYARGPGPWTGLRVGMTAARAYAWSLHLPTVGVDTFEALAAETLERLPDLRDPVAVAVNLRRDSVGVQVFERDGEGDHPVPGRRAAGPPVVVDANKANGTVPDDAFIVGDGASLLSGAGAGPGPSDLPLSSRTIGRVGARRLRLHGPDDLTAEPLYLRASPAEEAAAAGR